jgi:antitoxin component HigA of HigAB toxin-antitoxin module
MTELIREINQRLSQEGSNQRKLAVELGIKPSNFNAAMNRKRLFSLSMVKALYRKYPDLVEILLR